MQGNKITDKYGLDTIGGIDDVIPIWYNLLSIPGKIYRQA